jgi:superfamily II DNA/RNA helicase
MGLTQDLLRGIYAYGYAKPSDLQQLAIVPLVQGRDVIAVSPSGTGCTSTLVIGLLQRLDPSQHVLQALIVAPTRELSHAIGKLVESLGQYMNIRVHVVTGGQPPVVPEGVPHVVVGTPGRLRDWLSGQSDRDRIRTWALSELDEMQSRGFEEHLLDMAELLPADVQVAIEVGPNLPPETRAMAHKLTHDALTIRLAGGGPTLDRVRQFKVDCELEERKLEALKDIFASIQLTQTLIYCNTNAKVDWLAEQLALDGWAPGVVVVRCHDGMESDERQRAIDDLVMGTAHVMVATDAFTLGDRGPAQVSATINYDLPHSPESYLHRVGRSGRFGWSTAISLVTPEDAEALRDIETAYATTINDLPSDLNDVI